MKNSRNKIIAGVVCGTIIGSIGTSVISKYQVNSQGNATISNMPQSGEISQNGERQELPEDVTQEQPEEIMKNESQNGGRGRKGGHHQGTGSLETDESIDISTGGYSDGTYEGVADAYGSNLKVQVKVSSGKISNIEIVSHNETPGFYETAFEQVPAQIIEKQSTEVDTVSGATYTSVGIINAVNNALKENTSQ
ncbi:FMN-binding protein [Romboutsia sp.]|uniref:FMN-binding protein n=1 Tax=Romboutsia sp. TaxID=1965302 RepID=UPI003F39E5BF